MDSVQHARSCFLPPAVWWLWQQRRRGESGGAGGEGGVAWYVACAGERHILRGRGRPRHWRARNGRVNSVRYCPLPAVAQHAGKAIALRFTEKRSSHRLSAVPRGRVHTQRLRLRRMRSTGLRVGQEVVDV